MNDDDIPRMRFVTKPIILTESLWNWLVREAQSLGFDAEFLAWLKRFAVGLKPEVSGDSQNFQRSGE